MRVYNGSVIITLSLITLYILVIGADHGAISEREHADEGVPARRYQGPDEGVPRRYLGRYLGTWPYDENDVYNCYEDTDCLESAGTGGIGDTETADEVCQKMCDAMKLDVQWKTGKKYTVFQAKSYRAHHVGGSFYFIKVHVGGEDYIHICLFKDLPHNGGTLRFDGVQEGKTLDDHIEGFDRIEYSYE